MPHNFAHFTNEMTPFIQQLQSGEITADQFRDAMQNVETQQQDPLDMGTGMGALSDLGDKQSGGVQLQDPNPTSVGTDYSQLQKGLGGVVAPKGYYFGPADGMYKYGEGPYADETKSYLDSVGMTFDEFSGNQPQASAMDSNVPEPVAQDLGPDGSPQPPSQDVFLNSTTGNAIPGFKRGSSFVYMVDQDTGRAYQYDDNEGKSGDTGWIGSPPPEGANLKITGINTKQGDDRVNLDLSDRNLTWGGMTDPLTSQKYLEQANRDDKSDNDLFYDYNGRTYVDVSGTGESIPVGATNITRDPTQLGQYDSEGNYTKFDSSTYTSPVLDKTFDGYIASGSLGSGDIDGGLGDLDQSISPPATDSFLESIGTNTPYNIGQALGLGDFILSSPPSNRFNLEPFFNQAESFGTDNFLRSQQRDVLQLIKDGEFFTALAGKPIGGPLATDPLQSLDSYFDVQLGQEGLNEVLNQLQGIDNDPTTPNTIDPSFQLDVFDTDSDSQVSSITGDDEGTDEDEDEDPDPETPEATDPFVVRAYKGGGVGPFASNYIFQRFGYRPTETIDMLLRYDPVQELYFFENGQPVDPEFLQNMQLTKLDDEGQVVKDEEGNPVRMPKVVIEDDATTDEEEE
jgi:hypothetical protein